MQPPSRVKRRNAAVLCAEWPDGFQSCILLADLRESCPCAYCMGEEIMGQKVFKGFKKFAPGMNELADLTVVGNYAMQATWKDGHDSGIYTWANLRTIFESKKLSEESLATIDEEIRG